MRSRLTLGFVAGLLLAGSLPVGMRVARPAPAPISGAGTGEASFAADVGNAASMGAPTRLGRVPARAAGGADTGAAPQDFGNVPYDGRFTFVRIRFSQSRTGGGRFGFGREPPWAHDFPYADHNFTKILNEVTLLRPNLGVSNVLTTDDPELLKFPIAYLVEPGRWSPTPEEVAGLRRYLEKGGFLIVDDFRSPREWDRFAAIMRAALPDGRPVELELENPIFHSFFEVESLDFQPPTFRQFRPVFMGIFEDNDPTGRLMVIANFNNDIGDYWEYSDRGYYPIDLSNEAYKVGVNYIIYALTR